jgi:hypothetical protein
MGKIAAFFLTFIYLCATTECYQLLKLPLLISHYITHCEEDPDTTLSGFINEHYADTFVMDDDWEQDMELPFKAHSDLCQSISVTLHVDILTLAPAAAVELPVTHTPMLPAFHSTPQVNQIFQPPRYI